MRKFTEMNRNECRELRPEFEKTMKAVAKSFGVTVKFGSMRYTGDEISLKTTFRLKNAVDPKKQAYMDYKAMFKLPAFSSKVYLDGEVFSITGYNTRAKKYPIGIKNAKGQYKISVDMLKKSMNKKY